MDREENGELRPKRGVRCKHSAAVVSVLLVADGNDDRKEKSLDDLSVALMAYLSHPYVPPKHGGDNDKDAAGDRKGLRDEDVCCSHAVGTRCAEVDCH
jgi:hypothetical protein